MFLKSVKEWVSILSWLIEFFVSRLIDFSKDVTFELKARKAANSTSKPVAKRAIQIFDVNRDLIEAWGESEKFVWVKNSFDSLIGSVLVVDSEISKGYAVMPASNFYDDYQWRSNFGAQGWSDIESVT